MTTIPDCLAAFSVAAMTNSPDAAERGRASIDKYLTCVSEDPRRRLAALHELYAAYLELALDSAAALEIKSDIENRIVRVSGSQPSVLAQSRHVSGAAAVTSPSAPEPS